jgi:hypothetical protein
MPSFHELAAQNRCSTAVELGMGQAIAVDAQVTLIERLQVIDRDGVGRIWTVGHGLFLES